MNLGWPHTHTKFHMKSKTYITRAKVNKSFSLYSRNVQKGEMIEGIITEISAIKKYRFYSRWGKNSRSLTVVDQFAKQIGNPVYCYVINIWDETATNLKLKLFQNYCFYNFALEIGFSQISKGRGLYDLQIHRFSRIETAPNLFVNFKKKELLAQELSQTFNVLKTCFPFVKCMRDTQITQFCSSKWDMCFKAFSNWTK